MFQCVLEGLKVFFKPGAIQIAQLTTGLQKLSKMDGLLSVFENPAGFLLVDFVSKYERDVSFDSVTLDANWKIPLFFTVLIYVFQP